MKTLPAAFYNREFSGVKTLCCKRLKQLENGLFHVFFNSLSTSLNVDSFLSKAKFAWTREKQEKGQMEKRN